MSGREKFEKTDYQMLDSIITRENGSVFVPMDFLDLGSREAVDIVLHHLVRKGTILDLPAEYMIILKSILSLENFNHLQKK